MTQLSYTDAPAIGVPGTVIHAKTIITLIATASVRPGQYVQRGAGDTCAHPTTDAPTAAERGGVVINDPHSEDNVYAVGDPVPVLVEGRIVVATEDAVADGGSAFVRFVAAGLEENGAFRSDADTADAAAVPGLYFRSAGTLVELEVARSAV